LKNRPDLYLRADGNSDIGLGHIFRTLSIGEMVRNLYTLHFITREPSASMEKAILDVCTSLVLIPDAISISGEAEWMANLKDERHTIFVLDGYNFDTEYQRTLRSPTSKVISIDDVYSYHFVADAVINHAPAINRSLYSLEEYTRFCGGLKYAILQAQFLDIAKAKRKITSIQKLFICFGGADFNNLTTKVLHLLAQGLPEQIKEICVVIGGANTFKREVQTASKMFSGVNVRIYENLATEEMVEKMCSAQVAILPSSTILYEALAVKMPIISGYYVENQHSVYHGFTELGLIYGVDDINKFQNYSTLLHEILRSNPKKVTDQQARYINGSSKKTIRKIFWELTEQYQLCAASLKDLELFFDWANDTAVRKNAISSDPIEFEGHTRWFKQKLEDKDTYIYILKADHQPVGQIRFELEEKEAVIGYSIAKESRGRGFGTVLVEFGLDKLKRECNRFLKYKAVVKAHNIASWKVFEKLGFDQTEEFQRDGDVYKIFKLDISD